MIHTNIDEARDPNKYHKEDPRDAKTTHAPAHERTYGKRVVCRSASFLTFDDFCFSGFESFRTGVTSFRSIFLWHFLYEYGAKRYYIQTEHVALTGMDVTIIGVDGIITHQKLDKGSRGASPASSSSDRIITRAERLAVAMCDKVPKSTGITRPPYLCTMQPHFSESHTQIVKRESKFFCDVCSKVYCGIATRGKIPDVSMPRDAWPLAVVATREMALMEAMYEADVLRSRHGISQPYVYILCISPNRLCSLSGDIVSTHPIAHDSSEDRPCFCGCEMDVKSASNTIKTNVMYSPKVSVYEMEESRERNQRPSFVSPVISFLCNGRAFVTRAVSCRKLCGIGVVEDVTTKVLDALNKRKSGVTRSKIHQRLLRVDSPGGLVESNEHKEIMNSMRKYFFHETNRNIISVLVGTNLKSRHAEPPHMIFVWEIHDPDDEDFQLNHVAYKMIEMYGKNVKRWVIHPEKLGIGDPVPLPVGEVAVYGLRTTGASVGTPYPEMRGDVGYRLCDIDRDLFLRTIADKQTASMHVELERCGAWDI
jgi:hypothetical protein